MRVMAEVLHEWSVVVKIIYHAHFACRLGADGALQHGQANLLLHPVDTFWWHRCELDGCGHGHLL